MSSPKLLKALEKIMKILWQEKNKTIGNAIIQRLTVKHGSLKKR
jgi:predicted transcriptional regulator